MLSTWQQEKKTCFFITHDVEEAVLLSTKVIIMSAGPGRIREKQLSFLAGAMEGMPSGHCFGLFAMGMVLYPAMELVCVSAEEKPSKAFLDFLRENQEMGLSVLWKNKENMERLEKLAPFTAAYPIPDTGEVYFLCRGQHCLAPQRELEKLRELMAGYI